MFIVILPFWLWALLLPLTITYKLMVVGMRLLVSGVRLAVGAACWLARSIWTRSARRGHLEGGPAER